MSTQQSDYPSSTQEVKMSFLTKSRTSITPYLPPPVIDLMERVDSVPHLRKLSPEPTMVLIYAIMSLYLFFKILSSNSHASTSKPSKRKQLVDGFNDDNIHDNVLSNLKRKSSTKEDSVLPSYHDSVILFGPSNSGKTLLFHKLSSYNSSNENESEFDCDNFYSVMSLKANSAMISTTTSNKLNETDHDTKESLLQIVDYPGHISLKSQLPGLLFPHPRKYGYQSRRAILVIDSSKPISEAATLLYECVLTNASLMEAWENVQSDDQKLHILVACNKSDMTNSKTWRRMKISLRTELEKIRKIASSISTTTTNHDVVKLDQEDSEYMNSKYNTLSGKTIDLDDLSKNGLPMIKLHFISLSCKSDFKGDENGMEDLRLFVREGRINESNDPVFKSRHMS